MKDFSKLPIYNAVLDDTCEITTISLVEDPAMELPMFCFEKEIPKMQYKMEDEVQHNIISCIVRVDYPIYRIGTSGFEYVMVFTKDVAAELANRLLKDGYQNTISLDHNGIPIDGIHLQQLIIKDTKRGIDPIGFEDAADGSLFGVYHITDDKLWEDCVSGMFGGVSLESYLSLEKRESIELQKVNKNKFSYMKLRDKIVKMLLKFDSVSTDKADLFYDHEGELVVGDEVYTYDEAGERVAVEDGEYVSDGYIYVIKDGKVDEIREAEKNEEETEEANPEEMEEEVIETPAVETPVEDLTPRIDAIERDMIDLKAAIEEIRKKLEEIVSTPVVEPVVEEFDKVTKREASKNKYVNIFGAR